MAEIRQVLCMKWGTVYPADVVNRLYGMARRNISGDLRFICFTEDPTDVRDEVECLPLPELGCEIPPDVPGKWPKQALWGRDLFGLQGVALFIDLDSVIVDSLDPYFEHGDPDRVYVARNWVLPLRKGAQTSIFRFRIGEHAYMLDNLRADPAGISRRYQFEQNYVTAGLGEALGYWPERWTRHFRKHCLGSWPMRYVRPPKLPRGARVVTFPGHPKPEDAAAGRWSARNQSRPPLAHLRNAWRRAAEQGGFFKHVRRYVRPAPWVQEHYRP